MVNIYINRIFVKLVFQVNMGAVLLLFLIVAASAGPSSRPKTAPKCGYDSCTAPKEGMLNVHIVPHTHDDVGWLKTVDQYYYGSRNDIQKAGVQYILDSVVKELWEDPERRFIYVETAFFWKWWELQSEEVKSKVHALVAGGRLKFVGGAWSMNDEANTYYQTTVDQFAWGLRKLNETFGECGRPTVGWQIDPFGHSREFASLLAGMGYDGLFLGRIDYQDKQARMERKTMEMVWRGDDTLGPSSDIFTCVMYNTYSPPPGFCFDVLCQDEPIIDDPASPDYNVGKRVKQFVEYARRMASAYRTDNVIVTMGGDFTYQQAGMWFENLDKLIQYGNLQAFNENLNINLFYSTPDCYLKAVKESRPTLPTKADDFFPYASDPHSFWTGYFTSRPSVKYLEAETNILLQVVKQTQVLEHLPDTMLPRLDQLRSVMGVMQHHDAVTGTEKQHVAKDYIRMVTAATAGAQELLAAAFNKAMKVHDRGLETLSFDRCQFNESSCHTTETSSKFVVTVYNPLAWEVTTPVRVPVVGAKYDCQDGKGNKLPVQMSDIPASILLIPNRASKATNEATFIAHLPALGYKSFYLSLVKTNERDTREVKFKPLDIEEYFDRIKKESDVHSLNDKVDVDNKKSFEDSFSNDIIRLVPDEPSNDKYKYNVNTDSKAKNLLKTKDVIDKNVEEFGKLIENVQVPPKRSKNMDNPYNNMDLEEMRMLGDDPMVVTRYPDEEMADQTIQEDENLTPKTQSTGTLHSLHAEPQYYPAIIGNNMVFENRSSGAYIFRPVTTQPKKLEVKTKSNVNGDIFDETRQTLSSNVAFIERKYKNNVFKYSEIDWLVGPIPIDDGVGKEYVIKYTTDLITNGEVYTDSNGRQMLKRVLNKRPQWNLTLEEPVAGNYYPITSAIAVKGDNCSLTVLVDRAAGGASLEEGGIEVMVHRRLLHDDAFGVGEALNETVNGLGLVARGTHRVFMGEEIQFKDVLEMRLRPQIFVSQVEFDVEEWLVLVNEFTWLKSPLADGVHLLTVEPWGDSKLLLRLENYIEDAREVNLKNLLVGIKVVSVKEAMLAANQWAVDAKKWFWNTENEFASVRSEHENEANDNFKVKLRGKQIRTFIVDYEQTDN